MLIALLSDIHANRQAFEACLAHARAQAVERFILLGDFVGYGADPSWAVETAMELVNNGAIAVLGNHDRAVAEPDWRMNAEAQIVIDWTRGQLGVAERRFLVGLPLTAREEARLYVHADASDPSRFMYVLHAEHAARSLRAADARIVFCGHVHQPAIYSITATAKMTAFTPVTDVAVPLQGLRRWLVVLGSVGQPRDENPAASYAILDTDREEIVFRRVPYDIEGAAAAIRKAGLPVRFANRLFVGK